MTDTLVERRLRRWASDADVDEQAVAGLLATALAATRESLVGAASTVLDIPREDGERAAERLLDRPFVERVADGFRVQEPLASWLRARFRDEDSDRYAAVAESLVRAERADLELLQNEDDRWFARGRIAYYLAALDPEQSAQSFIDVFAHPPAGDPGPPRSWLTELVVRKETELADQARAVAFFVGFQSYKDGRADAAAENFETVLRGSEMDAYRAIALHLVVTLNRGRRDHRRSLREAIKLSSDLALVENEVMATNTLVYQLVASAQRRGDQHEMAEAALLAERNLSLAESSGDGHLLVWCLSALARTQWLAASHMGDRGRDVSAARAASLLEMLDRAEQLAESTGDLESVAESINTSAQIHRDRGDFKAAVGTLANALRRWRNADPPAAARRWGQTAGSMSGLVGPELRPELQTLRSELNRWLPPRPPQRHR